MKCKFFNILFVLILSIQKLSYPQVDSNNYKCLNELLINNYLIIAELKVYNGEFIIYSTEKVDSFYEKGSKTRITDFEILDCKTNKILGNKLFCKREIKEDSDSGYESCLWRNALVQLTDDSTINLEFLYYFPVGDNWEYKIVPFLKQTIRFSDYDIAIVSKNIVPNFEISEKRYNNLINDYFKLCLYYKTNSTLNDSILENFPEFMNKIFICALNGNTDSKKIFLDMPSKFPYWIQGIIDEHYYTLYTILNMASKEEKLVLINGN